MPEHYVGFQVLAYLNRLLRGAYLVADSLLFTELADKKRPRIKAPFVNIL